MMTAMAATTAAGWAGPIRRVARPVLATKRRSLGFLLVTAALSFGSLAAALYPRRDGQALPFDNKSELAVVIDLPEGSSVEATDRVARDVADVCWAARGDQRADLCRDACAVQLQRVGAALLSCAEPQLGEVAINLAPKGDRDRESHDIALDLRQRLAGAGVPAGTSLKVVEPPPGTAGDRDPSGRGLWAGCAETRREAATKIRGAFEACPSSWMWTTASAPRRGGCGRRSRPTIWSSSACRNRTCSTRWRFPERRAGGGLFAPGRGPVADSAGGGATRATGCWMNGS
jgi:multidrug efflux pump subunit AcrB